VALITLADARAHFDSDATDAKLQGFIDTAIETVGEMAGLDLTDVGATLTLTDEVDGGTDQIILSAFPVVEVTDVSEWNGATEQAIAYEPTSEGTFTDYGFRFADGSGRSGILVRTASGYGARWSGRVVITYTVKTPARYKMAALETVRLLWTKSQGMGATEYPVSLSDFDLTFVRNLLFPGGTASVA
jgi:hypothetical protein